MSDGRFTIIATSHFSTVGGPNVRPGDVIATTSDHVIADLFRNSPSFYAVFDSRETGKHAELSVTATSTPTCSFGECSHSHTGADVADHVDYLVSSLTIDKDSERA